MLALASHSNRQESPTKLTGIGSMSKLTYLYICTTHACGVTDLSGIGCGCANLLSVEIYCCGVTDLSGIGRGCPSLTSLIVHDCKNVTGLDEIGRGCANLTSLDASKSSVTDLSEIGRGCSKLTKLDISETGVTDLSEIGRGCPDLESLNITNSGVTALGEILRSCPKLISLFGDADPDPELLLKILRDGSLSASSKPFKKLQESQSLDFECVSAHDSSCFARAPRSAQADAVTLPRAFFL